MRLHKSLLPVAILGACAAAWAQAPTYGIGKAPTEAEMALRDAIQRIAIAHRFYGYRRVAVLVQREGYAAGAKKVRRRMKADNLLAIRRRKFVATTHSTALWCIRI